MWISCDGTLDSLQMCPKFEELNSEHPVKNAARKSKKSWELTTPSWLKSAAEGAKDGQHPRRGDRERIGSRNHRTGDREHRAGIMPEHRLLARLQGPEARVHPQEREPQHQGIRAGRRSRQRVRKLLQLPQEGCEGTYIKASPQHLAACIDEAVFRFNNRHDDDWTRFESAMRKIVGKRLMYKTLTGGAVR